MQEHMNAVSTGGDERMNMLAMVGQDFDTKPECGY